MIVAAATATHTNAMSVARRAIGFHLSTPKTWLEDEMISPPALRPMKKMKTTM